MSIVKYEDKCELEIPESVPEKYRDMINDGEMLLKAYSITDKHIPPKWIPELAEDSKNQRLLYRHRDPESEKWRGRPFGRILDAYHTTLEADGEEHEGIESWYRVFGDTEEEKTMQDWVKKRKEEGQKIGISKGFIVNRDKNGDIYRVFSLEDSVTHKPACKQATIEDIIQLEDLNKMENDKELTEKEKEIKKLQAKLEAATLKLEEKTETLETLEEKVKEFESMVEEKEDVIEKKEEEKETLEEKMIGLSDKVKRLEQEIVKKEKQPYLEELKKLEDPEIFEVVKDKDVEWIKNRLEKLKGEEYTPQVITKTLEEEKKENESSVPSSPPEQVFKNNPELLKQMKSQGLIK